MPSLKLWQLGDAEEKGIRSQRQTRVRLKKGTYNLMSEVPGAGGAEMDV